jgi:transcriptional regulator with XRE-family HTH domain
VSSGGAGSGSTVVRRQLGRRLRRLREEAGKSHEDVAEAQIASRTKMWRIEQGRTSVKQGDVLALARLYDLGGPVTDELLLLASGTRDEGWWEDYGSSVPEWVGLYAGLEAASAHLLDYSPELIHGLLQTPDYARTVTRANPNLADEVVEQRVTFRLQRQRAFFKRKTPGRLTSVVTAGAIGLVVGSDAVMKAQIAHLREIATGDEVSIRVLSATDGVHTAMRGPFTIMDFDDPEDPSLVYVESLIGSRYIERADQLDEYRRAMDRMQTQAVPLEEYIA